MENELPDHVRDYKLETRFRKKREIVHFYDDPDAPPSSQQREECWKSDKQPIGRGGQGQVFLQTCTSGSRHYTHRAVKTIPLQDGGGRRRYIRELETIIKFSHDKYSKYFVKSLGWYVKKDSLCIAMEYVPTGDLQTYLRDHPALPEDDSRQITSQVLRGLAIMHGEGFAHRDIKPQNVLIQQRPTPTEPGPWWVKLSDFGISKRLEAAASGATTVMGTTEYMAPEQLRCLPNIKYPAADMWALGAMTFSILTKSTMFPSPLCLLEYETSPDTLFPRSSLDDFHVSLDGQAFIRALVRPKPDERLDSKAAICHAWVQSWMPSAPIVPDDRSESSTSSSGRSSLDEERGMTTQVSNITDLPNAFQTGSNTQLTVIPRELLHEVQTRLLPAAEMEAEAEVKLLLDKGADLEAKDGDGRTPLLQAVANGHEAIVKLLLEKGADLEAKNRDYLTPLSCAVANGREAVAKLLLKKGANLEAEDGYGRTPLSLAAKYGHGAIAKLLLEKGADLEAKGSPCRPLSWAAMSGHGAVAKLFLEKGADLEARNHDGSTPLSWAAGEGHEAVAKLLLEKGADLEARNRNGSPLSWAAANGREAVAKLLLEKGADLEVRALYGRTPLSWAAVKGNEAIAKLLLEKGADLEARNSDGWTPLSWAAVYGNEAVAKLLLEKGADLEARDSDGSTPLSLAAANGHEAVVKLLQTYTTMKT